MTIISLDRQTLIHRKWALWNQFCESNLNSMLDMTGSPFTTLALPNRLHTKQEREREREREREKGRRRRDSELMASNNGLLSWLMECFWSAAKFLSSLTEVFRWRLRHVQSPDLVLLIYFKSCLYLGLIQCHLACPPHLGWSRSN